MQMPPLCKLRRARGFAGALLWLVYLWTGAGLANGQDQGMMTERAKAKAQVRLEEILSTVDALNKQIASLGEDGSRQALKDQRDLLQARQSLFAESNRLEGALNRRTGVSVQEIDQIIEKSAPVPTFTFERLKLLLVLLPVAIWLIHKSRKRPSNC